MCLSQGGAGELEWAVSGLRSVLRIRSFSIIIAIIIQHKQGQTSNELGKEYSSRPIAA